MKSLGKVFSKRTMVLAIAVLLMMTLVGRLIGGFGKSISKVTIANSQDFLKENHAEINLTDNDFEGLHLLDSVLEENVVFMAGETHGVAANSDLDLKFLKYFHKEAGVRYYLLEVPYSYGEFLNQYLESGDDEILKQLFSSVIGTYWGSEEEYQKWKKIYRFNKELPEDEKIKVVGIDVEHQAINAISWMHSLLPEGEIPKEIFNVIEDLKEIYRDHNYRDSEVGKFSKELKQSIEDHEELYITFLGQGFFEFNLINENILAKIEANESGNFNLLRDQKIYDNFLQIHSRLPEGKYYGQWGLNHVFQRKQAGADWIASSMMNSQDSPVKGKVISIVYLYENCGRMEQGFKTRTKLTTHVYNNEIFNAYTKTDYTLFRLLGADSPFQEELIWSFKTSSIGAVPKEGVTTDYYQYVVVIKNSREAIPRTQ